MNNMEQAKLYYLYMMSDGEISKNEMKVFSLICEDLCLDEYDRNKVIRECKETIDKKCLSCIEVLEKSAKNNFMYDDMYIGLSKYESEKDKASIMWNLVNLGYADKYFTHDEREVVEFIQEYWEIKDSLYQEMIDVAETILSLEEYKIWIEENVEESKSKQAKLAKIKKDIKFVQNTIKETISEFDY